MRILEAQARYLDMTGEKPWRDEETLRRLYVEEGMSTYEIAEELGCGKATVWRWMKRHGIERRSKRKTVKKANRVEWATYYMGSQGYARWCSWNPDTKSADYVTVHQLLACLDNDPHRVFSPDTVTHHKSGHPFDNRPGEVEVMTRSKHDLLHARMNREMRFLKETLGA